MGSAARPGEHGGGLERTGWGKWPGCLALGVNDAAKVFDRSCTVRGESAYCLPLSERRCLEASLRTRRAASRNGLEDGRIAQFLPISLSSEQYLAG
jgi:hypothetical protein